MSRSCRHIAAAVITSERRDRWEQEFRSSPALRRPWQRELQYGDVSVGEVMAAPLSHRDHLSVRLQQQFLRFGAVFYVDYFRLVVSC